MIKLIQLRDSCASKDDRINETDIAYGGAGFPIQSFGKLNFPRSHKSFRSVAKIQTGLLASFVKIFSEQIMGTDNQAVKQVLFENRFRSKRLF